MKTAVNVPCNACDADDAEVLYPAGSAQLQQIVRCRRCGLMYVTPRIHVDLDVFQDRDHPAWEEIEKLRQGRIVKEVRQVRDYRTTRKELARLHPRRGRLLDVGSGYGYLLDFFRADGWDVIGVDPMGEACEHARSELGIEAIPALLEDAGIPDESLDAVLMMHVIEHVPDPLATLREVHRVLKPGGHIIVETPRYDTLMFKLLGKRERSLSCNGHIWFFTNGTLRRVYERAGFRLVKHRCVGRSLTADRLFYNFAVMSKSERMRRFFWKASQKLGLRHVRLYLNVRDMQRVCLEKPGREAAAPPAADRAHRALERSERAVEEAEREHRHCFEFAVGNGMRQGALRERLAKRRLDRAKARRDRALRRVRRLEASRGSRLADRLKRLVGWGT